MRRRPPAARPDLEPIAIIGAGCRFPGGGNSLQAFWQQLRDGVDAVGEVPPQRWEVDRHDDGDPSTPGTMYSRWGSFLEDIDQFDAAFFGITPREARQIDPQQRLLLKVAWEALESAGIAAGSLAGSATSVFTGVLGSDYQLLHTKQAGLAGIDPWYATGKEASFGAGRISYLLGLNGVALSLSTACSSSLVATHLACQSLRSGESDLSLVGGVSLILSPELTVFMCEVGAMSPTGRCRVFDAAADGVVRGEACAVMVLKRLSDAQSDGDDVLAVIRGSAVNHDGRSAGLTVPNGAAQQALIGQALATAGVHPDRVDYVEAHGTGTPLGDPIEVESLAAVLCRDRDPARPLLIGSLKANFGHLDAAAGIAGLLKAALMLRHGEVPPQLHLRQPNPNIRWDRWPVRVPTELESMGPRAEPRVIGVSAFGLSGTNAHVVLEAAPVTERDARASDPRPLVLPISARSPQALLALAGSHLERLTELAGEGLAGEELAGDRLADHVATAATGREHHREYRLAVTGRDSAELASRLAAALEVPAGRPVQQSEDDPGPVFVFAGQGAQWQGMGAGLLATEPAFRAAFAECEELIAAQAGWSVRAALADASLVEDTGIAQPAVFAVQVALAALWRSWGIEPAAVIGHSVGEVAAAQVAGALALTDAVRIIVHRGRLLRAARGQGRMAVIGLPATEVADRLAGFGDTVTISALNSPVATVVSGDAAALGRLLGALAEDGVSAKLMPGEYAFHTPRLAPQQQELVGLLAGLRPAQPSVPIARTTPGDGGPFDAAYWGRNVGEPVMFAAALTDLIERGHRAFVELGPHPVLAQPIAQCLETNGVSGLIVSSLRRGTEDTINSRRSLAQLYAAGYPVAWQGVVPAGARRATIPGYPWQGKSFWFAVPQAGVPDPAAAAYDAARKPAALGQHLPGLSVPHEAPPADEEAPAGEKPAVDEVTTKDQPASVPSRSELERLITAIAAQVMGFDSTEDIRPDAGFVEAGMDSALAVQLHRLVSGALDPSLPVTAVFDHPSVRRLATHLRQRLLQEQTSAASSRAPISDSSAGTAPEPIAAREPIAVVGIGCRFPGGAEGPDRFWQLLCDGVDAIGEAPEGRFESAASWRGGFLREVDGFDARFFRIPPREARAMDPQQRIFLETAWEALEHAGQVPSGLCGTRTGVFLGMNSTDYSQLVTAEADGVDAFFGTGNAFCAAPGRLSYLLGVHGPSLAVDTACSSSLVAVHLACQSLRSGESEIAIAGGVNLILTETIFQASAAAGALAADGRCKTFAASADGYTRGEGCGVVVLKPLSRARADGDEVLAVILGSAVNQDGPSSGLTVPYGPAQESLIRAALVDAGVTADEIGYVEAHGTGTRLGDPIELQALGAALSPAGPEPGPGSRRRTLVGSVKTNIGHLEAAAGIAGLIKTVLALRSGQIPPHLHFDEPSPDIAWAELPFDVPTGPMTWPDGHSRRVAGVSAFGFSGTNAHVVLAQAPAAANAGPETAPGAGPQLLALSATAQSPLRSLAAAYADRLEADEVPPADLCHTAAARRSHHDRRLVVLGRDGAELAGRLRSFLADTSDASDPSNASDPARTGNSARSDGTRAADGPGATTGQARARAAGPVFIFSGHGSQWRGMARDLLASQPVFGAAIARCDAALLPHVGWSVAQCLAEGAITSSEPDQQILIFAIQVALAELWASFGVRPAAVLGHSMGEIAAAHVAGAIELADAARLISVRTRLLGHLIGRGGMAVVGLPAAQVEARLAGYRDRLCVAVVNSSQSTVVSGDNDAIADLGRQLKRDNVFFRRVEAGGPGHSPLAEPLRAGLVAELAGLPAHPGSVPFYSAVTGTRLECTELGADYWGRNLRDPVRFDNAIRRLLADGYDSFVELSPHPLLLLPVEHESRSAGISTLLAPSLVREQDGPQAVLSALATLHVGGQPIDLSLVCPGRHVPAPTYPWQHASYWVQRADGPRARAESRHPLITRQLRTVGRERRHYFQASLDAALLPADGSDVRQVPAGAWLELAIAAGLERGLQAPLGLDAVRLPEPLAMLTDRPHTAQLTLAPGAGPADRFDFEVVTEAVDGDRAARVRATGSLWGGAADASTVPSVPPAEAQPEADGEPDTGELQTEVDLGAAAYRWQLRPDLMEECLRLCHELTGLGQPLWRVASLDSLRWHRRAGDRLRIRARRTGEASVDLWISTPDGEPVATLLGLRLERWHGRMLSADDRRLIDEVSYRLRWRPATSRPATFGLASPQPAGPRGGWLVLADRGGVADALAARVRAAGQRCVLVSPDGAGLAARLRDAAAAEPELRGVVHLWALDLPDATPEAVYASVPLVARTLANAGRAWYVTRGAAPVDDDEVSPAGLAQAPLWRLAGVAGVENAAGWGGLLDLPPGHPAPDRDAEAIFAELQEPDGEDHVALRGGRRLVARLVHSEPVEPLRVPWRARPGRSYIVAGALGAAARLVPRWLSRCGAERVVLVDAEELGAVGAVTELAAKAEADGMPIGGVVWLGVDWALAEPGSLDPAELSAALRCRVQGARRLHEECPELDLFVVFAGVASAWGAVGAARQATADELLAALVRQRRTAGLPGSCINWAPWDDPAVLDPDSRARLVRSGLEPLEPATAIDVLDQLVADRVAQAHVARADWGLLLPLYQQALAWPLFDELAAPNAAAAGTDDWVGGLRAQPAERRRDAIVEVVFGELAIVLGLSDGADVELEQGFFAMGVTSITGLEFRLRLERRFGASLPATLVFEYPTVDAVVGFIEFQVFGAEAPAGDGGEPAGTADGAAVADESAAADESTDALLARLDDEVAAATALMSRRRS